MLDDPLADGGAAEKMEGILAEVHHLGRDAATKAGVDRLGGEVDEKPAPGMRTPPLYPCSELGPGVGDRQLDALERLPEDEVARFEDVRFPFQE